MDENNSMEITLSKLSLQENDVIVVKVDPTKWAADKFVPLFNAPDNIFIKDPIHNLLNVITFTFFKYDVNNIADRTIKNTANIA